jgi:hypothetical protein
MATMRLARFGKNQTLDGCVDLIRVAIEVWHSPTSLMREFP